MEETCQVLVAALDETGVLCVTAQAVLELKRSPGSASHVLGLKACATTPGFPGHLYLTFLTVDFHVYLILLGIVFQPNISPQLQRG